LKAQIKDRRDFLKFMGRTSAALGFVPFLLPGCSSPTRKYVSGTPFAPVSPTTRDDLMLAEGLKYEILLKWGEPINARENFGVHNDFLAFEAFKNKTDEGVLMVNHEYLHPILFHNRKMDSPRTKQEMILEQEAVGVSLVHIKKEDGIWKFVKNSKYNRRVSGRTMIPFQKGYRIFGSTSAMGTLSNCAGGKTPWGTFLTCEENYDIFVGEAKFENRHRKFIEVDKFKWYEHFPVPPEHYGWVVEIEPFTGKAVKRCALGRFEHESATIVVSKKNRAVAYMGEDRKGGYIYKFVSDSGTSLEKGTLYVADTVKGRWIPLDLEKSKELKKHFDTQIEVLTYCNKASEIVGATQQDRPEDIEIDPISGEIFIALTNNSDRNNHYGSILKIQEASGDYEAKNFKATTFTTGSQENGFACPDNMVFDKNGNLWFTTDMPEREISEGAYGGLGNNGLFYMPLRGKYAGRAYQVASSPIDAEFTGPMFSPDNKTLFLCVQHPGSETKDPRNPTSDWPERKGVPKSSVVTISGPLLDQLLMKDPPPAPQKKS